MEERTPSRVVLVMLGEAAVDVRESGPDPVLVPFQGGEVYRVGEVRGEELVALGFQARSVRGQVGELLVAPSGSLIERRVHFGGEVTVVGFADRDGGVGVRDEAFGQVHGDGAAGAGGLLGGSPGADEVGVGGAAGVGGEVQQHA
ncbi:hypothetical protein [Brooklawnia cerclae]|uniref:hypothetical protein n=1 Tax=Brooklawnia cerclae TaxID=349934 RepID=UPI001FBB10F1|nr:hypothetical protein [Brooklawnia cerclae]